MNHSRRTGALALTLITLSSTLAFAEVPESLGAFDGWSAYTYKAPDSKVCYVSSSPSGSEPKNV